MHKRFFLFGAVLLLSSVAIAQQKSKVRPSPGKLDSGFINPPVIARPKALWPWVNGNVNLSQISYELKEAKEKGMGGFDIWDVGILVDNNRIVPPGPAFLEDESLQAIAHAVREADRLQLELGLITSSSWNAGGAWVKPEHGAMGIFHTDTIVQGPAKFEYQLSFPLIPEIYGNAKTILYKDGKGMPVFYKEVAVLAHPFQKDSVINQPSEIKVLSSSMAPDGTLKWEIPPGKWRIARYICTPTGQPLAIPSPLSKGLVLDHFSGAAQEANMNYVLNKLKTALGGIRNRSLRYLYEDSYEVNSAVWTPELPTAFQQQFNYSLLPFLPVLDGFIVDNKIYTERFRFDFTKVLSELIISNHYKKGRVMAEKEGLGFYAEAGGPGQPIHNVPFEDLKALGSLTVPRGEFWNKHPELEKLQIVKGISSAAHIYNQRYVEAEAFTSVWLWQEGPGELKPLADRAMCEGLNRFVYHTFPHTPPESGKPGWVYNFGTLINTTNGWWELSKGFHDYLARSCYLLQQGEFVGDVAFYYGDRAPNFVSPKHTPSTLGEGYDYDVVNSDIILNKMSVKNNRIYLPHGQYYEVLVLPDERSMNLNVLQKLQEMIAAGATIIGPKPLTAYGLTKQKENDEAVRLLAAKIWGKCDGVNVKENHFGKGKIVWGKSVREVLLDRSVRADFDYSRTGVDSLDYIHRRMADADIYFIRNKKKSAFTGNIDFRVSGKQPELWQPENGNRQDIKTFTGNGAVTTIPMTLEGEGSCFIIFRKPMTTGNSKSMQHAVNSNQKIVHTEKGTRFLADDVKLISTPWEVRYAFQTGTPIRDTMTTLTSWHLSGNKAVQHYSGKATYYNQFELTPGELQGKSVWLELNKVKEIASVSLNGEHLGYHWHPSFRFDITGKIKPGKNYIVIEVANSINNWLIGDGKKPEAFREARSNITKLPNAWMKPFAEAPLLEAGLIGPVQIRMSER
jgi:hypothetical protein